ncbi:MAG: ATP-binding protein [Myxococcaceae bacterium]|nr:ATP-binding protein [Myxococcaceae bacterium]
METRTSSEAPAPVNILLVDDIPENLMALGAMLDSPEYRLTKVTSGEEALRQVLREDFAVILLDVAMPGMNGFEVAAILQQLERTRNIPILFVTAVATDIGHIYRAYSLGAFDYLIKPLDAEIVRKKVAMFVRLVRQREHIEEQARLLREAERNEYERRLSELRAASDRRYRKMVEGNKHAIAWSADAQTLRLSFMSRQVERILGYPFSDLVMPDFWAAYVHPDDRDRVLECFRTAVAEGTDQACEHRMIAADGHEVWFHTGVSVETDWKGAPQELNGVSVDITDLKRAEHRQRLLAEVSTSLAESLDYHSTVRKLAELAVRHLAEWCLVDEVHGPAAVSQVEVAHRDPAKEAQLRTLGRRPLVDRLDAVGLLRVLRTGHAELFAQAPDAERMAGAMGVEQPEALRSLGLDSCMMVPLLARGRVLGIVTLVSSNPRRRFDDSDLALAEELCARAALAIDNALLFQQAERATAARDELLAVVTHDLRNPLGSIVTVAKILEKTSGAERRAQPIEKYAEMILRSTERMKRLIADLLDLAKLDAGRMAVERQTTDAAALVRESLELVAPQATEKSLKLEFRGREGLLVSCDRHQTLRILGNLVGNAVKFTPEGGSIIVSVASGQQEALFSVKDSGPGISEEDLPHLFDRFWQAKKKDQMGVGLGLSIVRGLVDAHGGRVWAESKPGEGATFFFTLPLAEAGAQVAPPVPVPAPEEGQPHT